MLQWRWGAYIYFQMSIFSFCESVHRNGIARSFSSYVFNFFFFRNHHTLFVSSYTNLNSHQWYTTVSISSHCWPLLFPVLLLLAILTGVVLICTFLMIRHVEHLFMYLLTICMSPLEIVNSGPLLIFFVGLFGVLILSCMNSLHILNINPWTGI